MSLNKSLIITIFVIFILFLLIIIGLFVLLKPKQPLTLEEVLPIPDSKNVSIYPNIKLKFSRSLDQNEKKNIIFSSSPFIQYSTSWSNDNRELNVIVEAGLQTDKKYELKVFYLTNESYSWSFTTAPFDLLSESDLIRLQGQGDFEHATSEQNLLIKYPWYDKLPPPNDDYFIAFDPNTEEFLVDLYPNRNSSISTANQEANLKNQVLQKLQSIGVDTNRYRIKYTSYPQ